MLSPNPKGGAVVFPSSEGRRGDEHFVDDALCLLRNQRRWRHQVEEMHRLLSCEIMQHWAFQLSVIFCFRFAQGEAKWQLWMNPEVIIYCCDILEIWTTWVKWRLCLQHRICDWRTTLRPPYHWMNTSLRFESDSKVMKIRLLISFLWRFRVTPHCHFSTRVVTAISSRLTIGLK